VILEVEELRGARKRRREGLMEKLQKY